MAAVAAQAAWRLMPASWRRASDRGSGCGGRSTSTAGAVAAFGLGPFVVLVLIGAGAVEVLVRRVWPRAVVRACCRRLEALATGGLGALAWVAFKVGAFSYGGGFVIIPLMRSDAVAHYHWMTDASSLTPLRSVRSPPARSCRPSLLSATLPEDWRRPPRGFFAFAPSFIFVLLGGRHFDRLRANAAVQAFLDGAGPAAIGSIAGSGVVLASEIYHPWQVVVLVAAAISVLVLRRSVVSTLALAGLVGAIVAVAGLPTN